MPYASVPLYCLDAVKVHAKNVNVTASLPLKNSTVVFESVANSEMGHSRYLFLGRRTLHTWIGDSTVGKHTMLMHNLSSYI